MYCFNPIRVLLLRILFLIFYYIIYTNRTTVFLKRAFKWRGKNEKFTLIAEHFTDDDEYRLPNWKNNFKILYETV